MSNLGRFLFGAAVGSWLNIWLVALAISYEWSSVPFVLPIAFGLAAIARR